MLAKRYFEEYRTNEAMKERLKLKAVLLNPGNINRSFLKYNGKPCMVTKSNVMHRGHAKASSGSQSGGLEYVEMDINLRRWNFVCRQGLNLILPVVKQMDFIVSLIIQGDEDDELPERVLCCARLNYLNIAKAKHLHAKYYSQ